ncbi:MAG TPA: CBS domain-containing protein [Dissulfurispiraceae bacterium]|nr:CBS domain-containing protein [Dissulfurispiraceae bacterium]
MFIDKSMTREVITVGPGAGILEAREKMVANGIRHLPVVDQYYKVIGIISDRDMRSALPSVFSTCREDVKEIQQISALKVADVMNKEVITISPRDTLQDALLLMHKSNKGALPVVHGDGTLKGIISRRDLIRAFINVLGIEEPGNLLCIVVEEKLGEMKKIVDAIAEEGIAFGSILVARHWEKGKRAVFPYLLTLNVAKVKRKLENMGFTLIDPMEWSLDHTRKS